MKSKTIEAIIANKIIVIIRGSTGKDLIPLCEALYQGGIRIMEITFDQSEKIKHEETAEKIAKLADHFGKEVYVGAGTVLNEEQVDIARQAGAKFIISPDVNPQLISKTNQLGLVSIPGGLTPTEIVKAHHAGADFVKVFPAGDLGINYFKSILAPLNHIRTIAVGRIHENNLTDFLQAGAYGVGVGSNLVNKSLMESKNYQGITELAKAYSSKIKKEYDLRPKE